MANSDETMIQAFLVRVVTPLMVAAMVGVWAFASTRAGDDDLARVEAKGEQREARIVTQIAKLEETVSLIEDNVHTLEVEQAAFRAQVRAALRISENE